MPASFSEMLGNSRRIDIPKADGTPGIYVKYRPQSVTPRRMHELAQLEQAAQEAQSIPDDAPERTDAVLSAADNITDFLASMLLDWDLTDDEGKRVPATRAGLQDVDYDIQLLILGKIREDSRLGESNGSGSLTPSAPTSPRAVRRATSRRRSPTSTH